MKLSRRLLLSSLLAVVCGLGISCNKNTGRVKIAVVTNGPFEFWTYCEKGAKDAGEKYGVDVIFRMPEKNEVALQRDIINEVVRQGVSGVSLTVIDPKEQSSDLKAISQKVNLVTMDSDAEESGRLVYVGIDNYEAGKAAGFEPLRLWFSALYEVLLGQSQGPRFGSFAAIFGLDRTVDLIERALKGELAS